MNKETLNDKELEEILEQKIIENLKRYLSGIDLDLEGFILMVNIYQSIQLKMLREACEKNMRKTGEQLAK